MPVSIQAADPLDVRRRFTPEELRRMAQQQAEPPLPVQQPRVMPMADNGPAIQAEPPLPGPVRVMPMAEEGRVAATQLPPLAPPSPLRRIPAASDWSIDHGFVTPGVMPGMAQYAGTPRQTALTPQAPQGSSLDENGRFLPPAGTYIGSDDPATETRNREYYQMLHDTHPAFDAWRRGAPAPAAAQATEPPIPSGLFSRGAPPVLPAPGNPQYLGQLNAMRGNALSVETGIPNPNYVAPNTPRTLDDILRNQIATLQNAPMTAARASAINQAAAILQAAESHRLQYDPARESQRDFLAFSGPLALQGVPSTEIRRMFIELGGRLPRSTSEPSPPLHVVRTSSAPPSETPPLPNGDIGTPEHIQYRLGEIARPRVAGIPAGAPRPLIPVANFIESVPREILDSPRGLAEVLDFANKAYIDEKTPLNFQKWWAEQPPVIQANYQQSDIAREKLVQAIQRHYRDAFSRRVPILGIYSGGGSYNTPLAANTIDRLRANQQQPPLPPRRPMTYGLWPLSWTR